MPIFEFECKEGHLTEAFVKSDIKELKCKVCGKLARKIISSCTFSLKGHGWSGDGYRVENNREVKIDEKN